MDPMTIMMVATAVTAVGSIASGNAAAAQQESAANAANYNAQVNENNAQTALQSANANEEAQRRKSAQQLGQQRAGLAENGIGLDSGTATDLTEQSAMNAEMDALNIRYQGKTQAQAYKSGAALDRMQASQAMSNASAARTSGYLTAGASALSGYGRYSGQSARLNTTTTKTG